MKLTFNQFGQNLVLTTEDQKLTKRVIDFTERNKMSSNCKDLVDRYQNAKSEKVRDNVLKQLKKLFEIPDSDKTKKKVLEHKIKEIKEKSSKSTETIKKVKEGKAPIQELVKETPTEQVKVRRIGEY